MDYKDQGVVVINELETKNNFKVAVTKCFGVLGGVCRSFHYLDEMSGILYPTFVNPNQNMELKQ